MSIQTTTGKPITAKNKERVVVYSIEDGSHHECWPIDGRELVERGSHSWEPQTIEAKQDDHVNVVDEDATDSEAEEAEEEVVKPKRRRAR